MPEVFQPAPRSPLSPVLYDSPAVSLSDEQLMYIDMIADIVISDSQFRIKAKNALIYVLTNGSSVIPGLVSLNPPSAELGSPSFTLHVMGNGFTEGSQIIFNGGVEPTTFVSPTELTTGVNMDTAQFAVDVPVMVENPDGALSEPLTFSFTGSSLTARKSGVKSGLITVKEEEEKKKLFDKPKVDNKLPEPNEPMRQHKEDKSKG